MQTDGWVQRLLDTPRLIVEPRLAIIMGINESIIFRRLHEISRHQKPTVDGERWIYRTYENWKLREFTWLHEHAMRKTIAYHLGKKPHGTKPPMGVLEARRGDRYGSEVRIDYAAFKSLVLSDEASEKLRAARERCQTFHRDHLCTPDVKQNCLEVEENLLDAGHLTIQPVLAELVGLNESILLRQLHLSLKMGGRDLFGEGRAWVSHTLLHWQGLCPWLHVDSIRGDYFPALRQLGLVLTRRHPKFPGNWYTIDRHALCSMTATDSAQRCFKRYEEANSDGPIFAVDPERASDPEKSGEKRALVGSERAFDPEKPGKKRALVGSERAFDPEKPGKKRALDGSERAFDPEKSGEKRALVGSERAFDPEKSGEKRALVGSERAFDPEKSGEKRALVGSERAFDPEKPGKKSTRKPEISDGSLSIKNTNTTTTDVVVVSSEKGGEENATPPPQTVQLLIDNGVSRATAFELADAFPPERIQEAVEHALWKRKRGKCQNPGGFINDALVKGWTPPAALKDEKDKAARAAAAKDAAEAKRRADLDVAIRAKDESLSTEKRIAHLDDAQVAELAELVFQKYQGNVPMTKVLRGRPARECGLMKMEIVLLLDNGIKPKGNP